MSVNKLIPEKIEILEFKILNGQINSPFDFEEEDIDGHVFDIEFELGFNVPEKLVRADFNVLVETKSKKNIIEEAKGVFHFVFIFFVENIEELINVQEDNTIDINGGLGNALASITYSTSRGVLMTRFQGTALESFILPVINPNDLLKK